MLVVVGAIILLALLVLPGLWAKKELERYSEPLEYLPGSGGELAVHLIKTLEIKGVKVEVSPTGDHYDPEAKAVRLTESNLNGKSLTAVAVAAHEVGHALQDHTGYPPLKTRTALVKLAAKMEKFGSAAMLAIPLVAAVTRSPHASLAMMALGFISLGSNALAHLVTLPVEWDASFGRALPILKAEGFIDESEEKAVKKILRACAFTYVASSLSGLLNVWRWIAVLRR